MLPSFVTFEYQRHFDRVEAITGITNSTLANISTPVKWQLTTSITGIYMCICVYMIDECVFVL